MPWDSVRPQSPSYSGSEDSGSPRHGGSSPSKDRKVISLKMCFVSRNLTMPDLENRQAARSSSCHQSTVWFSAAALLVSFSPTSGDYNLCPGVGCWSSTRQTASIRWCCDAKTPPRLTPGSLPCTQTSPPCCRKSWLTSTPTWEPRCQHPPTPTSNTSAG